jgi:hypothetical protein
MTVRESFLTVDGQLAAAPGPSHYTPFLMTHVKGGDSLQSKAERFSGLRSRIPGPGTYSVSKKSDWLRKTYPPPSDRDEVHLLNAGIFKSGRLTFTRKLTAPSIPTPGKSCGYDETGDGNLTPQPLPPQDSTMGPAYYDVSHDATSTTAKYKGVHFGNQQSLRTQFKGREGPGPGDYHPSDEDQDHPNLPPHNPTSQSQSLPRYHILVTRQEEKKAVPGPGQYEIKSQFRPSQSVDGADQNDYDEEEEYDAQDKAPFGSRQQRFISPKHHSPACTSYNDPRTALSLSGGGRAGGRAPFGQSSLRFRSNRLAREIPAIFGEDVGFGGVFRCSANLRDK